MKWTISQIEKSIDENPKNWKTFKQKGLCFKCAFCNKYHSVKEIGKKH